MSDKDSANKVTMVVDQAYEVGYVPTVNSIDTATSASNFSTDGTLILPTLNIVGGGVTGSLTSNSSITDFSGSQYIDIIPANTGNSVKWFVFIEDGTNSRASKVVASWNTSSSSFYTTQFQEIGSVPVDFSVSNVAGNIRLLAIPRSGSWSMRLLRVMV